MKWMMTGTMRTGKNKEKEYACWSCLPDGRRGFVATIYYSEEHGFLDAPTACNFEFVHKESFEGMSLDEAKAYVETLIRLDGLV